VAAYIWQQVANHLLATHFNARLHVQHFPFALSEQLHNTANIRLRDLHHGLLIGLTLHTINLPSDDLAAAAAAVAAAAAAGTRGSGSTTSLTAGSRPTTNIPKQLMDQTPAVHWQAVHQQYIGNTSAVHRQYSLHNLWPVTASAPITL
jgi:hypothetical protein